MTPTCGSGRPKGLVGPEAHKRTTVTAINGARDSRLPQAGTLLTREFKGQVHVVKVLDDGFEYEGRQYKSLSKIATQIAGGAYTRTTLLGSPQSTRFAVDRVLGHYGHSIVFVNGKRLAEHKGGYTSFRVDITAALRPAGRQELVVAVWDPTNTFPARPGSSGWVTPRSFLLWPPFYSGRSSYCRVQLRVHTCRWAAATRISRSPSRSRPFISGRPASDAWRIIRLASRDDPRLLRLVSRGEYAAMDRFEASEAREIQITRVAGEVFTLRPVAPLEAGEYVLCAEVPGGASLKVCYSFGIQR